MERRRMLIFFSEDGNDRVIDITGIVVGYLVMDINH